MKFEKVRIGREFSGLAGELASLPDPVLKGFARPVVPIDLTAPLSPSARLSRKNRDRQRELNAVRDED